MSVVTFHSKDPDLLNNQFQHILIIDENATIKDLEDVIIQAVIYRLLVFVYEVSDTAMNNLQFRLNFDSD